MNQLFIIKQCENRPLCRFTDSNREYTNRFTFGFLDNKLSFSAFTNVYTCMYKYEYNFVMGVV